MVTWARGIDLYGVVVLANTLLSYIVFKKAAKTQPLNQPKVSILIPARDEENNLAKNLPYWTQVKYPHMEILVLDDQSTDQTGKVLAQHSSHITALSGETLPPGWLGKNWACDQLAKTAKGDLLIFVDADVTPEADAVAHTVATLEKYHLSACSFFLRQNFSNPVSKAVIPWVLQFSLLAWVPHFLSLFGKFRSLVVGNGQWFAVTRSVYFEVGGHEGVKGSVIEDMALSRKFVQAGVTYAAVLGPKIAEVTMYRSGAELRAGLNKNLSLILGPSAGENIFFLLLYLGVLMAFFFPWGLGSLAIALALIGVQFSFGTRKINPLLWIPGLIASIFLLIESMINTRLGKTNWKGREI